MNKIITTLKVEQISNFVYCDKKLENMQIESKLLPNPYYDYPYLIIENFLEDSLCDSINTFIDKQNHYNSAKLRVKNKISLGKKLDKKIRNTNIYKLDSYHESLYHEKFAKIQKQIEEYFKLPITYSTQLQVLEYKKGFFYKAHSDDSSMIYENDELVGFSTIAKQRKITSVLFTSSHNDEFEGGELKFNFLYDKFFNNMIIKPKKGDMLVFLSNPYFTHEVLPVKKGRRVTLVQWHNCL